MMIARKLQTYYFKEILSMISTFTRNEIHEEPEMTKEFKC